MTSEPRTIDRILGPEGLLSRTLKGFEFRSFQMEMARRIMEAIGAGRPALIEAGTGTGKTFGYLVPIAASGKKALISTATRTLQDQIHRKDIPLLESLLDSSLDALVMKGRKNYLCLHRYQQRLAQRSLWEPGAREAFGKLERWLPKTLYGDRSELGWLADEDPLWDEVSANSEQCLGGRCPILEDCLLNRLRAQALKARIVIVNHHLFFSDMKVREGGFGRILPRSEVLVFDEAHRLEEIATLFLGERISTLQLLEWVRDMEASLKGLGLLGLAELREPLRMMRQAVEELRSMFQEGEDRGHLGRETALALSQGPAGAVLRAFERVGQAPALRTLDDPNLPTLLLRARELAETLRRVLDSPLEGAVRWYERTRRALVLHISPLEVAQALQDTLYDQARSVILTSATLSTGHNFSYVRSRLGVPDHALEGLYPSHFSFETQALLYIPRDLPPPPDPRFRSLLPGRIRAILSRTRGRALVLFTSYENLRLTARALEGALPYTLYRQGEAPRSRLLEAFSQDVHSVLLATGSFWQGVDVPGEALSCLIIDKLPFGSPGDPLIRARIETIRQRGGNPFLDYQVPEAVITLKQGLGRLIRKATDRGIMAVLDVRILQSRYGRLFLQSLPPVPVTHDLEEVGRFFLSEKEPQHGRQAVEDPLNSA